ncbi:MAG: hypothetical protein KGH79_03425 [Patescibacteria group bacterium]|nr:hypothetical protein [Patescibacteria group bacterium]
MNATAQAQATPLIGQVSLKEQKSILVKFFFTNEKHVPRGVPNKDRAVMYLVDYNHAQKAKSQGQDELAKLGRHREGRVDTGEPVIKDLPGVQAALLKDRLTKAGFALKNLHWFKQVKEGRTPKFVVVCEFARGTQATELPADVVEALDFLSYAARWYCHVWDNRTVGNPLTINFVGRQPDAKVQYYLSVVDETLLAIPA